MGAPKSPDCWSSCNGPGKIGNGDKDDGCGIFKRAEGTCLKKVADKKKCFRLKGVLFSEVRKLRSPDP